MTYSAEVLADSPSLYWRLGESSGSTAADSSGNGRTGTYFGSSLGGGSLIAGDTDAALQRNADSAYANRVGSIIPSATSTITVEAWFRSTANGVIFSLPGNPITVQASSSSGLTINVNASGSGSYAQSVATNYVDDQPHHVVLVFNSGSITTYVDGASVATGSTPGTINPTSAWLGRTDGTSTGFRGRIDEFAVYNTALSSTRVAAHYAAGIASGVVVVEPPLIAATTTVYDPTLAAAATVVPSFWGPTSTVYSPTIQAPAVVMPSLIESTATVFEPAIPDLLTAQPNRDGAWDWDSIGEVTWNPVVVEPTVVLPANDVVAQAYPAPAVSGTHLLIEPTYMREPAHRDRIVIAGRDITFWRDIPTPPADFQLVQPLGYGAATIRLPQAVLPFETPGAGDLDWLRKGAAVVIQRVDTETNAVVATDWRGIVMTFDVSGGTLTIECGGDATGRAALLDRQMRLIQRRLDAGFLASRAINDIRLRHVPSLGATTGIDLIHWGGGGMLDYINELVSKMTTVDGISWTVMPAEDGTYRTYIKDVDTIHGTVYLDDARVKADLRSDLIEEPNRIFASGVSPEGMAIKFGVYPGLIQGETAPYPFTDGRTFGPGTVDADTDTGDGITVMTSRLLTAGLIDAQEVYNLYDADEVAGIKELQRKADLAETGNMNPATWDALFDLSATGFTLRNIRIEPAAAIPQVLPWRLSASGAIIGRNPNYDPSVVTVDRTIAMGSGFTRTQIRDWAQREIATSATWRGTITITTGAIVAGDHTPGSPISSILRARDIRPGMNLSLPLFAGGITVHVAGVSVTDDGNTVMLAVDTRPGDTIPVWAAIQQDRQNRETVHRSFFAQRKASNLQRENTFDEVGGTIAPTALQQGWNVIPVVAKQAGTIEKIRLRVSPDREFVTAVFGRRITPRRLRAVTNAPLTVSGRRRWTQETVFDALDRDHVVLYVAGSDEDPCGYFPGRKSEDDSITGRWEDYSSFDYVTFVNDTDRGSVLWLAIWVPGACTLGGGRIMWPSSEDY